MYIFSKFFEDIGGYTSKFTSNEFILKKIDLVTTFPNINIALHMFLCTRVSNCSIERSFSALKTYQELFTIIYDVPCHLIDLAAWQFLLLITCKLDFSEIIKTFAKKQARRKNIEIFINLYLFKFFY